MSKGFRGVGGGVMADFDRDEVAVLLSTAKMMLTLIEPPEPQDELAAFVGIGEAREAPADPAVARLFPDAYEGDEEAAGDFRRYTEDMLREQKRAGAQMILDDLSGGGGRRVELSEERALVWLKALNDIRLVLGAKLEIDDNGRPGENVPAEAFGIYDWLTALQDSLVRALDRAI